MSFLRKAVLVPSLFTLLLFFTVLLFPHEARADNLTITGGFVNIGGAPLSRNAWRGISFNFAGKDLAASGGVGDGDVRQAVASPCGFDPCSPGTIVSPNASATLNGVGQAAFNGTTTNVWWFAHDSLLTFTGEGVLIPVSTDSVITLSTHFTMSGSVVVHSLDNASHPVLFSTEVNGSGIATLTMTYFPNLGPGGYVLSNIRYDFTSIPEPATVLLLGSGLAGLVARRKGRRRRKS